MIKLAELLHTQDLETSHAVREDEETRYVLTTVVARVENKGTEGSASRPCGA
jgi:hypothetical protein